MPQSNLIISEKSLTFDTPIEYKGLKFYPARVLDYFDFHISLPCLLLDQFNDKDVNKNFSILQMSYLDYIFFCDERDKEEGNESYNVLKLLKLISICTREDLFEDNDGSSKLELYIDNKNKHILEIMGVRIDSKDFEEIRRIICCQNDIDISIFDLDPLVRKNLNETSRLQSKMNKEEDCSLEDKIVSIMICTSLNPEQISELTIRKFKKILERTDHKMHYEIFALASQVGFVEFKEKYPHWLSKIDKNISKNVTSLDNLKKKIDMGNGDMKA